MAPSKRRRLRLVLGAAVLVAALVSGFAWLRDSELVAVRKVTVEGIAGAQARAVRSALTAAAEGMTTLHVRTGDLRDATEPYPIVRDVRAEADFPHGLRVWVDTREPVAALEAGGRRTAVAADGTLLRDSSADALPAVGRRSTPGTGRVTDAATTHALRLLAAAPRPLRARVRRVFRSRRGLTAGVNEGPKLYFGAPRGFAAKWAAAARVLADEAAGGATYIDVRLPSRPAVGGLPAPAEDSPSTSG